MKIPATHLSLPIIQLLIFSIIFFICLSAFAAGANSTSLGSSALSPLPLNIPPNVQISASFVPTSSNSTRTGQVIGLYNQNCGSGYQTYALSNGLNYLVIPQDGNYLIGYWVLSYNNNGGSVEWNTLQFNIISKATASSPQTLMCSNQLGQPGGGCNSCGQYNEYTYGWWTCSPHYFKAGTMISIQGAVIRSGTHCGGNSVLINGGNLSITQQ